jgi:hypothetical protein
MVKKKDKREYIQKKINPWVEFRKKYYETHKEIKNQIELNKLASIEYNKLKSNGISLTNPNNNVVLKEKIYIDLPKEKNMEKKEILSEVSSQESSDKIIAKINGNVELEYQDDCLVINNKLKYKYKDLIDIKIMKDALDKAERKMINNIKEKEMEDRLGKMPYPQSVNRCKNCGKETNYEFCSEPCYNTYNQKQEVKKSFFKRNWGFFLLVLLLILTFWFFNWEKIKSVFI